MKKRNGLIYFLQETAIVVIGVLIAVSIGNYKERIDNEDFIKKTLLVIENEIEESQSEVDTVIKRHLYMIEALETLNDDDEQTLGEMIGSLGGVQFPLIKNISLRFFISNKAELVDFAVISALLEIENHSNVLSDKMQRLADFAYENVNDSEDEAKITFGFLLADVIDSEQSLLASYSSFIKGNNANLNFESQ